MGQMASSVRRSGRNERPHDGPRWAAMGCVPGTLTPVVQRSPNSLRQPGVSRAGGLVLDGERDGALATHDHDELLAAGHGGVEQAALQHHVVLGREWDHDGWVLRALAL